MKKEEFVEEMNKAIRKAVTSISSSTLEALKQAKDEEEGPAEVQLEAMLWKGRSKRTKSSTTRSKDLQSRSGSS